MSRIPALFLVAILSPAVPCAAAAPPPNLHVPAAAWQADLETVRRELPRRHMNAFHAMPRARFELAFARLKTLAPAQDSDQRFVSLFRVINEIGDGHTSVIAPGDRAYFPIEIREFGDELRVSRVAPGYERALGMRVLAIGGRPVAEVLAQTLELTPADENASLRRSLAANYLSVGLMLHGLGIIADRMHGVFRLQQDGAAPFNIDLPTTPTRDKTNWLRPYPRSTMADQHPGDPFWCAPAHDENALYCDFRGYDQLGRRSHALFDALAANPVERLVIDLRENGGGDYTEGERWIIRPIVRLPAINRRGRLFVLIGPQTFSAAMNNAAQFRTLSNATLVGETIGEKPNSYQEPRELTLPNSHLVLRYSTRWYAFQRHGPNRVDPDVHIAPTWRQYAVGEDPVLAFALSGVP
jgi:hypothetical protein